MCGHYEEERTMTPKFRAWDKGKNQMIQVLEMQFLFEDIDGIWVKGYSNDRIDYEIFPENLIVMQWTGLLDKNGVEIFEGDIVEQEAITSYPGEYGGDIDLLYIGVVVMIPSKGACLKRPMVHDRLEDNQKWRCDYYKTIASYRSKVIGNIHATSELLNGEAKDA